MEAKRLFRMDMWLLGHKGYGATNTMIELVNDLSPEEIEEQAVWFGRDKGEPYSGDPRDIIELRVKRHEFMMYTSDLPAMKAALHEYTKVANEWGDHNLVGGVAWTITGVADP
jgi:hypothetical protein